MKIEDLSQVGVSVPTIEPTIVIPFERVFEVGIVVHRRQGDEREDVPPRRSES